ncbi:LysM domain-containing protein [Dongia mobilis]|uniref:LysM domain-containing protein n=1 Tax=Dongia mobilis TaxID=578943 RepID=A0A4R6WQ12_9PROT|nr:LysM peptidoglycan-binding domain-containing protein [Dongia mobilis]TDQ80607.1 LysM domain-containing protein [Dongia mobilis]
MTRLALIGTAGAVVVIVAAGLIYAIGQQEDDDTQETPAVAEATESAPSATPEVTPESTGAQPAATGDATSGASTADSSTTGAASSGGTETGAVANPAAEVAAPETVLPSFDVVRVNPNGDAVIAGRAAPGARVVLLDDGKPIGEAEADDRGEWVLLPDSAIEPGTHKFTLQIRQDGGGGAQSERMVIVVVPAPAKDIAGNPVTEPAGALALSVPQSGEGASQILNLPTAGDESGSGPVEAPTLDVLDFDQSGRMAMSGRAPAGGEVRLYLNNQLLGAAEVDQDGRWAYLPDEQLPVGTHELRIDQVDGAGNVVNRIVQPVQQPDLAALSPDADKVIVQPGNSLWRLARRTYGEGMRYSIIYEANKDRIRDPDLIYPGQVFDLPQP